MKAGDMVRILHIYKSAGIVRRPALGFTTAIGVIIEPWDNSPPGGVPGDSEWYQVWVESTKKIYPKRRLELINASG